MAEAGAEAAPRTFEGRPERARGRLAIVVSRFNERVTGELLAGALECLEADGRAAQADVIRVPGAWELPGAAARALRSGRYAAVVALGCVIRGETPHFDYVAGEASAGLMRLGLETGVPVTFGVLTTDTLEQALARAGGTGGNKGFDATEAALELVDLYRELGDGQPGA
ncbi:MAG TPA: 6,7-dimethyl-8-ribityllumazine synthase [Longimicrobiales bacterium]|nr:6,7-dimethyl-8-ribityllumazine synthase [Longimicrobiales bacterium]